MYSYEIPSRLSELGLLDYSAQPLAGATLNDLDPNQRVRLRRIIQNRQGGEKTLLTLSDDDLDVALRLVTDIGDQYVPSRIVKLFIQRAKADLPFAKFVADEQNKQGKSLSLYTLMILSVINNERRVGTDRIIDLTNLSENKVRTALETMVEQGLIEASGKGRNRTYILGRKLYRENKETIKYVRQTDIDSIRYPELVLKLATTQGGFITKKDVIELLNITPSQAYKVLQQLQSEGKIRLAVGGKYSKYQIIHT